MNLIFFPVRRTGVSTRLKSYNPHAALARRGVYGVVVSGDMMVMEYLLSSRELESVEPAQPDPMIIIDCFDDDMAEKVRRASGEEFQCTVEVIW